MWSLSSTSIIFVKYLGGQSSKLLYVHIPTCNTYSPVWQSLKHLRHPCQISRWTQSSELLCPLSRGFAYKHIAQLWGSLVWQPWQKMIGSTSKCDSEMEITSQLTFIWVRYFLESYESGSKQISLKNLICWTMQCMSWSSASFALTVKRGAKSFAPKNKLQHDFDDDGDDDEDNDDDVEKHRCSSNTVVGSSGPQSRLQNQVST